MRFRLCIKYIFLKNTKIKGLNLGPHEVHVRRGFPGREDSLEMVGSVSCLNAGGQLARNKADWPNIQNPV